LQEWAKENFQLKSLPTRSLVTKIIKNKTEIMEKNAEATQLLDRKRKRKSWSSKVATLEEELLNWVQHHDATHGGRVPLTDAMMIQKEKNQVCACVFSQLLLTHARIPHVPCRQSEYPKTTRLNLTRPNLTFHQSG
jgi:hypothetical protein